MGYMSAELYYKTDCTLGEGPIWDHRYKELLWLDIDEGIIYFLKDGDQHPERFRFDNKIGFATPTKTGDYIVGLQNGLHTFNRETKTLTLIEHTEAHLPHNRWNDGKCSPDGNLWAGTMSTEEIPDQGGLYVIDKNKKVDQQLDKVGISNGLAWNVDLNKMYYIDSPTRSIQVFDYKLNQTVLKAPSKILSLPENMGYPDGMTIDEDGMLWVAHWDGHCIARWHPETGQLITKIEIPAPRVTSCIFGGKDYTRLYITTARTGLSQEQLQKYPLSGSVFVVDTNTKGKEITLYKG